MGLIVGESVCAHWFSMNRNIKIPKLMTLIKSLAYAYEGIFFA